VLQPLRNILEDSSGKLAGRVDQFLDGAGLDGSSVSAVRVCNRCPPPPRGSVLVIWPITGGSLAVCRFVNRPCSFAASTVCECDDYQLDKMTARLAWLELQHLTRGNARACAMRVEAAALRRDITEARGSHRTVTPALPWVSRTGLPSA
jgi:hypothetical protein